MNPYAICLSPLHGLAANIYFFSISPAEAVSGPGGLPPPVQASFVLAEMTLFTSGLRSGSYWINPLT